MYDNEINVKYIQNVEKYTKIYKIKCYTRIMNFVILRITIAVILSISRHVMVTDSTRTKCHTLFV